MDGVLVREEHALPGAAEFLQRLADKQRRFLVLTNNSIFTPRDLAARLKRSGLTVPEESIWTSATATAAFLHDQLPGGSAYVIGEAGLTTALHEVGYTLTDSDPDFVVLGETRTYSFEAVTRAVRLIGDGARFIATNPDVTGPSAEGPIPATGSVAAMITTGDRAAGSKPMRGTPPMGVDEAVGLAKSRVPDARFLNAFLSIRPDQAMRIGFVRPGHEDGAPIVQNTAFYVGLSHRNFTKPDAGIDEVGGNRGALGKTRDVDAHGAVAGVHHQAQAIVPGIVDACRGDRPNHALHFDPAVFDGAEGVLVELDGLAGVVDKKMGRHLMGGHLIGERIGLGHLVLLSVGTNAPRPSSRSRKILQKCSVDGSAWQAKNPLALRL